MGTHKPTPEQQAVIEAICNNEPVRVDGVAGCGKTSTLVLGVNAIEQGRSIQAVAFNRRNADDLKSKMPPWVQCTTMNSLGHRTWMRHIPHKVNLKPQKVGQLTTAIIKETQVSDDEWRPVKDLVIKAKVSGLVPASFDGKGLIPDEDHVWEEIAYQFDIDCSHDTIPLARKVLARNIEAALKGEIDFDDQLYMPVCFGAKFESFSQTLVDEAQDLSPIQHQMIARCAGYSQFGPKGVVQAIGDPNQAIYAFRGADAESLDSMQQTFGLKSLPLTYSFRCPRLVVEEAQQYVPRIQSAPGAAAGSVSHLGHDWNIATVPYGAAVLCRNTAPLISLAYAFIRIGKTPNFIGRNLGAGLTAMIKAACPNKNPDRPIVETLEYLERYYNNRRMEAKAKKDGAKLQALDDRRECIHIINEANNCDTGNDLIKAINSLFDKTGGHVTLSTIHRAKGSEWADVYFLNSSLIPSRYAKSASALQQEDNLAYVGVTRSLENLSYVDRE